MFLLNSLSTEILSCLITLILVVLTVTFWNRLSARKWHYITARVLVLVLIQIFALTSTGIAINRAGEFYASWGDLLGSKNQLAKIAIEPSLLAQISAKDIQSATKTAGGSLIFREVIKGSRSGISDVVYVVLPPKIAAQMEANPSAPSVGNDYHVVELFSGYPGVPQTWIGSMSGITTLEKLENAGLVQNTIAIIPSINVAPGLDTECLNFVGGPQVQTWITSDMRDFASKFIGIDKRLWNTFGYSTGGWCAAVAAIFHPDMYANAVVLAGYFTPSFNAGVSKREKIFLTSKYSLIRVLKKNPTNVHLMIIASQKDAFTNRAAHNFMNSTSSLISTRYVPIPLGGHNTTVWKPFVATAFKWIDAQNVPVVTPNPH